MIQEIRIKNFKCFDMLSLPLCPVNVFTGLNGVGKSTVIQSLLLLRQSYLEQSSMNSLVLNGRYARLGNGQDVLYEKALEETVGLGFQSDMGDMWFEYDYVPDFDRLPMKFKKTEKIVGDLFQSRFLYLSAYRIEPKELYRITNEDELRNCEFGNNGEFALQYLSMYGNEAVKNSHVILQKEAGNGLINQLKAWMDRIAPGVMTGVTVNSKLRTSELRYEFVEGKEKTNSYKSMNVGFGITYVLPLIIALLSAEPGDIVVLENPEAHIHPAGQRMLGELIALTGCGGVQILVETHSDHIINGIRLAVKSKKISGSKVNLVFFYKDSTDSYRHKCVSPQIAPDGRLDIWPDGFLDEWDKALYELI